MIGSVNMPDVVRSNNLVQGAARHSFHEPGRIMISVNHIILVHESIQRGTRALTSLKGNETCALPLLTPVLEHVSVIAHYGMPYV